MKRRGIKWKVLIVSLIITYSIGFVGSFFTAGGVDSEWYESIKPGITPPGYVFGIVWSSLFLLIGLALYFSWVSASKKQKRNIIGIFGINFIANILWSYFYFGLRNPALAFFDLIIIWVSIIGMIYVAGRIDKKAGWLLVPYFLWVSFAGVLNYLSI